MFIPNKMKTQIASVFYDKTVEVGTITSSIDTEGGLVQGAFTIKGSFDGNVSFSNCQKIQEEYGLDYQIDISITCDYRDIDKADLLKYQDVIYRVTDILPFDSHILIVGAKWQK